MDIYLWGPLVRAVQAVIASFPTLFVGWLIAAVFESILGREGTFKLFGGRSWRQLPQAWLLGMLLPVCSLGVIPVMVQMRKSGIAGGTILAFGLTAPLFNPISVLYGLTLSDPIVIMVFCLCSLTIVTANGLLWDWFFPASWIEPEKIALAPGGFLRVGAFCLSLANQAWNRINLYILGGYVGVALLAMVLPAGVLQHAAAHDNLLAPLTMASVATFAYVTPMAAIVQVASMFEHGNSIGAAFTLLVLGTGVNVGSFSGPSENMVPKRPLSGCCPSLPSFWHSDISSMDRFIPKGSIPRTIPTHSTVTATLFNRVRPRLPRSVFR